MASNIEDLGRSLSGIEKLLKGVIVSQENLGSTTKKTSENIADQSKKLSSVTGFLSKHNEQITKMGKSYLVTGSIMMAFGGAVALPVKFAGMMDKSFGSAFKTMGDFQNKVFLTTQSLSALGSQMGGLRGIQSAYSKEMVSISENTRLSKEQVASLLSTTLGGMRGARGGVSALTGEFEGQAKTMANLVKMGAQLGGSYDESSKKIASVAEAAKKYYEVQQMIEEINQGGLSAGSVGKMVLLGEMAPGMEGAIDGMLELNKNAGKYGKDQGRKAFETSAEKEKAQANAQLDVQTKLVEESFPNQTQALAKNTYALLQNNAGMMASAMSLSKGLEMVGGLFAVTGGAAVGAGLAGKVSAGASMGGLASLAAPFLKGKMGSGAALVGGASAVAGLASGEVQRVWIANTATMPVPTYMVAGMGAGSALLGGAPPGKTPLSAGSAGSKVGLVVSSILPYALPLMIAGAAVTSSLSDRNFVKEELSKSVLNEEQQKDSIGIINKNESQFAISGGLAGAAIGTLIAPGIGTAIGGAIGLAIGSWGGRKLGKDESEFKYEGVKERALQLEEERIKKQEAINSAYSKVFETIQQVKKEAEFGIQTEQFVQQNARSISSAYSSAGPGFGMLAAPYLEKESQALLRESAAQFSISKEYEKGGEIYKQMEIAVGIASDDLALAQKREIKPGDEAGALQKRKDISRLTLEKEEKGNAFKYIDVAKGGVEAKAITAETASFVTHLKAAVQYSESLQQIAASKTSLASAVRDYHNELRMGIGVSYQDQLKVVKAINVEVGAAKMKVKALSDEYQETLSGGTKQQQDEAAYRLNLAEVELKRKEIDLLKEAKSMREGYLDAIQAEVFGVGGYTELVAKKGSGHQFFAEAAAIGGTGKSKIKGPARYTEDGLQFAGGQKNGTDAYTNQFMEFIEKSMGGSKEGREMLRFLWSPQGPGASMMQSYMKSGEAGSFIKSGEVINGSSKKLGSYNNSRSNDPAVMTLKSIENILSRPLRVIESQGSNPAKTSGAKTSSAY